MLPGRNQRCLLRVGHVFSGAYLKTAHHRPAAVPIAHKRRKPLAPELLIRLPHDHA